MPPGPHQPPWRQVLEAHTTWRDWTAGLSVEWLPDGVCVRQVTAVPDVPFAVQGQGGGLPPQMRFWRLARYALPRWRVALVPNLDATIVQLRIEEDLRYGSVYGRGRQ